MKSRPTVFVVEDDREVREGIALLLRPLDQPVEVFASAHAFLAAYEPSRPGCLVLDVRMPGLSGLELQERLAAHRIRLPIIFISGHADVPTAVRALKAGAVDFLEKPFNGQALCDCIQRALQRDAVWRAEQAAQERTSARLALLTPGERSVLELMAEGDPYKIIARKLGVSYKTVEARRAQIMKKLHCGSLAELVRLVVAGRPAQEVLS
jgi:two-component system, LuxR family, response regulator FixJ